VTLLIQLDRLQKARGIQSHGFVREERGCHRPAELVLESGCSKNFSVTVPELLFCCCGGVTALQPYWGGLGGGEFVLDFHINQVGSGSLFLFVLVLCINNTAVLTHCPRQGGRSWTRNGADVQQITLRQRLAWGVGQRGYYSFLFCFSPSCRYVRSLT